MFSVNSSKFSQPSRRYSGLREFSSSRLIVSRAAFLCATRRARRLQLAGSAAVCSPRTFPGRPALQARCAESFFLRRAIIGRLPSESILGRHSTSLCPAPGGRLAEDVHGSSCSDSSRCDAFGSVPDQNPDDGVNGKGRTTCSRGRSKRPGIRRGSSTSHVVPGRVPARRGGGG